MPSKRDSRLRDRSPASVVDQPGGPTQQFRRLRKWGSATWKWLNGLPVRNRNTFDCQSTNLRGQICGNNQPRGRTITEQSTSINKHSITIIASETETSQPAKVIEAIENIGMDSKEILDIERPPVRIIHIPPDPLFLTTPTHQRDDVTSTTVSNEILTAKYTVVNFLPKNIAEQLRRVANIYFVVIIILQCIPAVSNYNPVLAAMPIICIMGVTAIKDAVEDWRRHHQDNEVNYSSCWSLHRAQFDHGPVMARDTRWQRIVNFFWSVRDWFVLGSMRLYSRLKGKEFVLQGQFRKLKPVPIDAIMWQETFWRDLRIGDIVLLRNNERIPADTILLSSSETNGTCFVETKNLDGETNLKLKRAPLETSWIQSAEEASHLRATIEVELPHANLYAFQGKVILAMKEVDRVVERQITENATNSEMKERPSGSEANLDPKSQNVSSNSLEFIEPAVIPVGNEGLLLRGCVLRNTPWVIGVTVYTGPDTKLMLNTGGTPSKRTRIERQLNPQIILIFGLLFVICISCAIVQTQFSASSSASKAPYWISSFQ